MSLYYDTVGRLLTLEEWVPLLRKDRHIASTHVGRFWVSTVYLGLDHSFGSGPPLIYETMVFKGDSRSELYMDRYATATEARHGHEKAVRRYNRPWRRIRDVEVP